MTWMLLAGGVAIVIGLAAAMQKLGDVSLDLGTLSDGWVARHRLNQ